MFAGFEDVCAVVFEDEGEVVDSWEGGDVFVGCEAGEEVQAGLGEGDLLEEGGLLGEGKVGIVLNQGELLLEVGEEGFELVEGLLGGG